MSITLRDGFVGESLDRILEDLLVRFVINCPDEDLSSIERVFFQIEEAQWYYLDFIRQLNPALPGLKMKGFSTAIIERCPMIWRWGSADEALARFGKYKRKIPVRGAALLNTSMDKLLLVKGTESKSWGFPRGKISKDEEDVLCAIREVKEETGFDCTGLIDASNYAERTIQGKNYKIFIIDGVPDDQKFEPHARNEISEIAWMDLRHLNKHAKLNASKYFLVSTMLKPIMSYVARRKGQEDVEDTKRRVARELKALLGISDAQAPSASAKTANIDPGRDLLEQLKAAAKTKQLSADIAHQDPAAAVPGFVQQQQQQQQQQLPGMPGMAPAAPQTPAAPFAPFPGSFPMPFPPFMPQAGFSMPFAPNMIQDGRPVPPQFYPPFPPAFMNHTAQYPVPPPQQQQQQQAPQFASEPRPESLQRPSFSLANTRSKEADSRLLLGVLNGQIASKDVPSIPAPVDDAGFGSKEMRDKSKSSFLMGLFHKNSAQSAPAQQPAPKFTLLKREPAATEVSAVGSATDLPGNGTGNGASTGNGGAEILDIIKEDKSSPEEYSDSESEDSSQDGDAEFEDFEDFESFEPSHRGQGQNLLNYQESDEEYEYEASESDDYEEQQAEQQAEQQTEQPKEQHIPHAAEQSVSPVVQPAKIQILKREQPNGRSNGQDLLSLLKHPKEPKAAVPQPEAANGSARSELLSMLDKNDEKKDAGSAQLLSLLKKPAAPQATDNGSASLLSILKRPSELEPVVQSPPKTDSANLLSILKRPSEAEPVVQSPAKSDSANLLSLLTRPKESSPAPVETDSANLLSLLNRPSASPQAVPQTQESASSSLLSLLKSPRPQEHVPAPLADAPAPANQSAQLLSILQNPSRSTSTPEIDAAPAQQSSNGGSELLSILRRT